MRVIVEGKDEDPSSNMCFVGVNLPHGGGFRSYTEISVSDDSWSYRSAIRELRRQAPEAETALCNHERNPRRLRSIKEAHGAEVRLIDTRNEEVYWCQQLQWRREKLWL